MFLKKFLVISLICVAGWCVWRLSDGFSRCGKGLSCSASPEMPRNGEIDHRFKELSVWQAARLPLALRFDQPMGTESGGLVYNAQKYWDMNVKRGGNHTGDDLNGIGGMNTDLGDPLYSVADGLVLYAGEPSSGWGNILVIGHRAADGRSLFSMYAHMDRMEVSLGSLVARGQKIGTVGTAHNNYPAHLHFEIRSSDGVDIGGGYDSQPLNHLNPLAALGLLRGASAENLSPSALSVFRF